MKRHWLIPFIIISVIFALASYRTVAGPKEQTNSSATDRKPDEDAIRKVIEGFSAAFEKGDAAAAVTFLTSGAEINPDEGPAVIGRDAIQKLFEKHFASHSRVKITRNSSSMRFTSRDTAIEEGVMTVTSQNGGTSTNQYRLFVVREDGKWLLAVIREWDVDDVVLNDLDWLIGSWTAKRADAEIRSTYEWFGNKTFIKATFTIREKDKTFSGMQLIGTDPVSGDLRTWVFEHDGAFGEGKVTQDGKKWVFEMSTTLPDGGRLSVMNVLVPVDKDTFTWQPLDLTIDDEQFGNVAPMKVTRVRK